MQRSSGLARLALEHGPAFQGKPQKSREKKQVAPASGPTQPTNLSRTRQSVLHRQIWDLP